MFHKDSFFYLIVLISETQIVVYCSEKSFVSDGKVSIG